MKAASAIVVFWLFLPFGRAPEGSYRCRDLRHRFVSVFFQRTGNLAALQVTLEHATVAMTMRYSHLMTEHLHLAMTVFDAPLGPKVGTGATVYG